MVLKINIIYKLINIKNEKKINYNQFLFNIIYNGKEIG